MTSKKTIFKRIILLIIIAASGYYIYVNWFKIDQSNRSLIPMDKENSLITTRLSTEKGERSYYIARSHIKKGIIWKYAIDSYDVNFRYERRFRRDVMLQNNEVSFYVESEEVLYKFNYEDGSVIDRKVIPFGASFSSMRWGALQDRETLYLLTRQTDDLLGLVAINFQNFETRWQITLGDDDYKNLYGYPLQSENWIALHKGSNEGKSVLLINKNNGETISRDIQEYGFLLEDSYYYLPASSDFEDEERTQHFSQIELSSSKTIPLFIWEEGLPKNDPFVKDSTLWHYKESLIYIAENEGSVLKSRDLKTGELQWEIPFPKDFEYISSHSDQIISGAPEFSGVPNIKTPFLPLVLGESNSSSFDGDQINSKICIIDMEKGLIHWESNPVYQAKMHLESNIGESSFYKNGEYCLFLTIPERMEQMYPAILFIDGKTGERVRCIRFWEIYEKGGAYLSSYSLDDQTLRSVTDRSFSFSDREVYPLGDVRRIFASRKFIAENVAQELGEIYGF